MELRYTFTYKCRYCDKLLNEGYTGKAMAMTCLIQTACNLPKDAQHPGDRTIHFATDHVGIADLVGCKIEED